MTSGMFGDRDALSPFSGLGGLFGVIQGRRATRRPWLPSAAPLALVGPLHSCGAYALVAAASRENAAAFPIAALTHLKDCATQPSSDPIRAYPELPQQRIEGAKEEKQTQGYEKDGECENEK